jgi:hypothetical protein
MTLPAPGMLQALQDLAMLPSVVGTAHVRLFAMAPAVKAPA